MILNYEMPWLGLPLARPFLLPLRLGLLELNCFDVSGFLPIFRLSSKSLARGDFLSSGFVFVLVTDSFSCGPSFDPSSMSSVMSVTFFFLDSSDSLSWLDLAIQTRAFSVS